MTHILHDSPRIWPFKYMAVKTVILGVGCDCGERTAGKEEGSAELVREKSMSSMSFCEEMKDSKAGSMMSKVMERVESVSGVRALGPRWWSLRTEVWVDGSQSHVFCFTRCELVVVLILASRSR